MGKPNKPTQVIPRTFGGTKSNFSELLQNYGFQAGQKEILQGDNLNYMLNALGGELTYLRTVVDYLVDNVGANKFPYVDSNNNFSQGDINTLLPTQTDNAGKFLTTNGTTSSWSASLTDIGDPIFTFNFNKTLSSDYIWLDGRELAVSEYPELFAIYGYAYSDTTGSANFKVPNFYNCTIWGGTTAGKVEAGLPNITGSFSGVGQYYSNSSHSSGATLSGAFYRINTTNIPTQGVGISNDGKRDDYFGFDASKNYNTDGTYTETLYGKSNTVQPPALKVRAYTRVR